MRGDGGSRRQSYCREPGPVQRFHNEAIQAPRPGTRLRQSHARLRSGNALAGIVSTGGGMPKRAGAMSEHEMQIWIFLQSRSNLRGEKVQFFRPGGVGAGFVCDQRSAEFEKDKGHGKNVARYCADVKKV